MTMHQEYNVSTATDSELGIPQVRKKNWMMVYAFLGSLAVIALVLTQLYGRKPKRFEPMPKRTIPAVRSVYTLVFSPLDSLQRVAAVTAMRQELSTSDSSRVNLVLGSTMLYKRFISASEYASILDSALLIAKPAELRKQATLFSHMLGVMTTDTLPAKLYLFGELGSKDFSTVEKRLNGAANVLVQRNSVLGHVELVSYLTPSEDSATRTFLQYFRNAGVEVTEKQY